MRKILKIVILFAFLISGVFAFSVRQLKTIPAPAYVKADDKSATRDLYQQNCARCHGADGKSETELGKLFDAPDLTSRKVQKMGKKQISRVIVNGKGGMPAFKKKLTAAQIASLTGYVRSLK